MPQCQPNQLLCNNRVDYTPMIVADRIFPFVIELDPVLSILVPQSGENQRFCYRITGVGEGTSQYVDLSHWVLSLCPNIRPEEIVDVHVSIDGVPQTVIFGPGGNVELFVPPSVDPQTGCPGLKFDFPVIKVLDAPGSTALFCFDLTTVYPIGAVNTCLSGGNLTASGLAICGPTCPTTCSTTVSQLIGVCVPITITPFACVGAATTICCGDPLIGEPPCPGVPGEPCSFTVSQLICVEIPVSFGATGASGEVSGDCGTAAVGSCVCPETPPENGD